MTLAECRSAPSRRSGLFRESGHRSGSRSMGRVTAGIFSESGDAEIQVAAFHEGFDLPVGDAALEHPEAAIGMRPADALRARARARPLRAGAATSSAVSMWLTLMSITPMPSRSSDRCRAALRDRSAGRWASSSTRWSACRRVEESDQRLPVAALDGLPAVVAEAEVHGALDLRTRVEHAVDRLRGERGVGGIAGDVGFIHLHAGAGQIADLRGEHIGDGQA